MTYAAREFANLARMRPFLVLLALAVLPLQAQMPVMESIEVRVVNVDVVVTDRDGKPVTGLTKEDFEILEDKRPQKITNIDEVRGGESVQAIEQTTQTKPAPAAKPRNFILFVDNRAMHPVLRKQVVAELKKFVDERLRPEDQATVISWSNKLNIEAPLTTDRGTLHAALDKIANTGTPASAKSEFQALQQQCTQLLNFAKSGRMPFRLAYEECIGDARIETQRVMLLSRAVLNALEVAMSTVAGVDGKKIVVMAGTELPVRPGTDMYNWANSIFTRYMQGTFDAAIKQPQEEAYEQRKMLEELGRSANAHGATLYMLSVLMPTDNYTAVSDTGIDDNGADFARSSNTEEAHKLLAKATGGAAGPMSRIGRLFDTISTDLDWYYSLGYRPSDEVKGTRPITVRMKNPNYTARARQSYAPKTFDDQMADRVVANIFTPARKNEWQVQLRTSAPRLVERGRYAVDIEVLADPRSLTFIPQDNGELVGVFKVFVAVGTPQGALSTTFRQPNEVRIKSSELKGFRETQLAFTATLTVREGENLISVGMLDHLGQQAGFARATVVATPK